MRRRHSTHHHSGPGHIWRRVVRNKQTITAVCVILAFALAFVALIMWIIGSRRFLNID